MKSMKNVLGNK